MRTRQLISVLLIVVTACERSTDIASPGHGRRAVNPRSNPSLLTGLEGYYPLDGNATDASGNAEHAAAYGVTPTVDRFGQSDRAFAFDGQGDSIVVPAPVTNSRSAGTISLWLRTDNPVPTSQCGRDYGFGGTSQYCQFNIFGKRSSVSTGQMRAQFGYGSSTEGSFYFTVNDEPPFYVPQSNYGFGSWHMFTFTWSETGKREYLDDVKLAEDIGTFTSSPTGDLILGHHGVIGGAAHEQLSGAMDDVRFYSRELTASEVATLFSETAPPPVTTNIALDGDTYIRQGSPNQNQGSDAFLRLRQSGKNRALIHLPMSSITAVVGTKALVSAHLKLTISDNGDNWGTTGRPIDLHALTSDWTELGATWNCAIDSSVVNSNDDCSGVTRWAMDGSGTRPWVSSPTASSLITTGQMGTISLDVTSDIAAWLAGARANQGWILKKRDEGAAGHVEFASRESAAAPQLSITVRP